MFFDVKTTSANNYYVQDWKNRNQKMNVLLVQIDGSFPNLALMRIAAHHRVQGDFVYLEHLHRPRKKATLADVELGLFSEWDKVYGSLIFTKSQPIARRLLEVHPHAVIGGSGWGLQTVEHHAGIESLAQDYSDYPAFHASIGFSQRGCRLNCGFCVVPQKEGKVHDVATINEIWRGPPYPRDIVLLDNDFFGSPTWREKIEEIKRGNFRVSLAQGINARLLPEEGAKALASINYRSISMKERRLYTAWDNLGDERALFRGLKALKKYGVRPDDIMVYMLIGYAHGPTLDEEDFERHRKLREFGCRPYPMYYEWTPELQGFQRWIVLAKDKNHSWAEWKANNYQSKRLEVA
jgi:hypothetical protein